MGRFNFYVTEQSRTDVQDDTPDIEATFTFIVTDACGLRTQVQATAKILDSVAVLAFGAQDMTVEADILHNGAELTQWLNSNGGAQLTADYVQGTHWSYLLVGIGFTQIDPSTNCKDDSLTAVFTASNANWASPVSTTASFTVMDRLPPVIEIAASNFVSDDTAQVRISCFHKLSLAFLLWTTYFFR